MTETSQSDINVSQVGISADGRYVTFSSDAGDLIPGEQSGGSGNVYLYDRTDRSTRLVSHLPGSPLSGPENGAFDSRMSADGRFIVFLSNSPTSCPARSQARALFSSTASPAT